MNHISDEKLLQHISDAVSQITPDKADDLWNEPVTPADGSEWYLDSATKFHNKKKKKMYFISAVAACCVLCLISTFMFQVMPSASVYLDVNPSILLKVNYQDHVTDVVAYNDDAEQILENLDLRGTDLNVVLYAILGSMVHHGYLTEYKDTVLVSVHSANTNRANELEDIVSNMITNDLDNLIQSSNVLTHSIDTEKLKLSDNHSDYTPGKDSFIKDLIQKYPQLKDYPLDSMTMDEITSLLNEKDLDYSDYKKFDTDDGNDDHGNNDYDDHDHSNDDSGNHNSGNNDSGNNDYDDHDHGNDDSDDHIHDDYDHGNDDSDDHNYGNDDSDDHDHGNDDSGDDDSGDDDSDDHDHGNDGSDDHDHGDDDGDE